MKFPLKNYRTFLRILFWSWVLFIVILMLLPISGPSQLSFQGRDKVVHFTLFFILGAFFASARTNPASLFRSFKKNYPTYLTLLFAFGLEGAHLFLNYRDFELLDSLTNVLGILSGMWIGSYLWKRLIKK